MDQDNFLQREALSETDISLLDLLVTLTSHIKLIIFGSLTAGLSALVLALAWPPTYQSVAVLQGGPETVSLMTTATVLDPLVTSLGLYHDKTAEEARTQLRQRIKTSVGRSDKLITLTVAGPSPQQAQTLAMALLNATYENSQPKGSKKERLLAQLAEAKDRFKSAQQVSAGYRKSMESVRPAVASSNALGNDPLGGYADLLTASSNAQKEVAALEVELEGVTGAQLVQAPTLPQQAAGPHKGLVAVVSTLGAALLLVIFIFARSGLRHASTDPLTAAKMAKIRKSLHLS